MPLFPIRNTIMTIGMNLSNDDLKIVIEKNLQSHDEINRLMNGNHTHVEVNFTSNVGKSEIEQAIVPLFNHTGSSPKVVGKYVEQNGRKTLISKFIRKMHKFGRTKPSTSIKLADSMSVIDRHFKDVDLKKSNLNSVHIVVSTDIPAFAFIGEAKKDNTSCWKGTERRFIFATMPNTFVWYGQINKPFGHEEIGQNDFQPDFRGLGFLNQDGVHVSNCKPYGNPVIKVNEDLCEHLGKFLLKTEGGQLIKENFGFSGSLTYTDPYVTSYCIDRPKYFYLNFPNRYK